MDQNLKKHLATWTVVNPNCVIIEQDEVGDSYQDLSKIASGKESTIIGKDGKPVKIYITEKAKSLEQSAIGTGIILKKCDGGGLLDEDPRNDIIKVGDRVKFSAGTQINAEFKGYNRVQILHINNILMVSSPSGDNSGNEA